MSTQRWRTSGGPFAPAWQLPKGPNGRNLCRWCGTEVPPKRVTFCSPGCVDEFVVRSNSQGMREVVWKRDRGLCALCGETTTEWEVDHIVPVVEGGGECGLENLRTLCKPCHRQVTRELIRRLHPPKPRVHPDQMALFAP